MIFGLHRVSDLGELPFKAKLPEPRWLTATNFSDNFIEFHEEDGKLLAITDIGCSESMQRVVEVDLENPEKEHWREVVAAEDFMPDNGIQAQFVADGKLGVVYWKDGFNEMRFFDLTSSKVVGDIEMPFPASINPLSWNNPSDKFLTIGL